MALVLKHEPGMRRMTDTTPMELVAKANRNVVFVFATRIASLVAPIAIGGVIAYFGSQTDTIARTKERVDRIEFRLDAGLKAREEFQADTVQTLKEIQQQQSGMLQSLAAIIARMDERDRKER